MRTLLMSLVLVLGSACISLAGDVFRVGTIEIETPWARASIGTNRPAAAYLTLRNTGSDSDRLVEVKGPIAEMAHIHSTTMEGGIMRMSAVGSIEVAPGQTVTLSPGGKHIMLMKLNSPLKKGETTHLTLTFERAGKIAIPVPVFGPGAQGPK